MTAHLQGERLGTAGRHRALPNGLDRSSSHLSKTVWLGGTRATYAITSSPGSFSFLHHGCIVADPLVDLVEVAGVVADGVVDRPGADVEVLGRRPLTARTRRH